MTFKKIALVFCVLCPFFICSCLEYTDFRFVNKSSYLIQISLSEPYKETNSTDAPYLKTPFYVYSRETAIKYVKKNDVDYTWTAYNPVDNPKIRCTTDGAKATFENQ